MIPARLLLAATAAVPAIASASCGAAFCTINTNWTSESALVEAGSAFDVRYEYIDQDQPMSGTDRIAVGQIPHHHDEVSTLNRNLVASYSRSFASGWGFALTLPVGAREHLHVHNHHGARLAESWDYTRMGDLRATGRFQRALAGDPMAPALAGVTFGLKLPTGATGVANAAGSVAERSLQPGSGTTDLLLGAFYHQKLMARELSWFAQAQYQHALGTHAGFKPGSTFGADLGLRRSLGDRLGALVQLNLVRKGRDGGSEGEPDDSGSRSVFLSPGLSWAVGRTMQVYGYWQQPLYRQVNGVQLSANRAFVVGLSGQL